MLIVTEGTRSREVATDGKASHRDYRLGPFRFDSEFALPELRQDESRAEHPVRISLGPLPADLAALLRYDAFCAVLPQRYLLDIPGVARYLAEYGSKVQVEPYPGAQAADVRGYLLGSVFGALCHQNGFLPLHASAIETGGQVTAFLGDSGAGKSTTAAFLERAGYRVVSDDICLLVPGAEGLRVEPVAGWLKLWRESFETLGEMPDENNRIFSAKDKYRRYLAPAQDERLELRNVVFLERGDNVKLERVSSAAAMAGLVDMTYLSYLPALTGGSAAVFRRSAEVLQKARAWRLVVPRRWDAMPLAVEAVESLILRG